MILAFAANPGAVFNLQKLFRLNGRLGNAVHTCLDFEAKVRVDVCFNSELFVNKGDKNCRQSTPPEEIRKGSDVIRRFMRRRFFPDAASMRGSAISAFPRTGLPLPA